MEKKDELIKIFAKEVRDVVAGTQLDLSNLQEIRLRVYGPLLFVYKGQEFFVTREGRLTKDERLAFLVTKEHIKETLEYISSYSLYAFDEEIRQGFLTIQGGHRIGLSGKVVASGGKVQAMKYISFLNVRLSHQILGCADLVLPYLYEQDSFVHTLILSPPGCGKTTLLRDIIRQVSMGNSWASGKTVGVVDERSELAACYLGIPQNDLGIRTDVLDCCPKAVGMRMLIRSMSPQVVAVDELGSQEDLDALNGAINCGCKILATVHATSLEDLESKPVLGKLCRNQIFKRYIVLNKKQKVGHVEAIFDQSGQSLLPERRSE